MGKAKKIITKFFKKVLLKMAGIVPNSIFEIIYLYYLKVLVGATLHTNKILRNIYLGKRAFFIGNGPSLSDMDLSYLNTEYVFAVNSFYLHPQINKINPDFYCVIDPWKLIYPNGEYKILFRKINNICKTNNDLILFFNIEYKKYIDSHKLFKNTNIYYLKPLLPILESNKYYMDISQPHSFMDGSSFNAMICLAYMGFKKIYFVGCDLTLGINKDFNHFYDKNNKNVARNDSSYLSLELKKWRIVVNSLQNKGVKIYNAGLGGNNNTCPRVDYLSLFNKKLSSH